jgi:hypothetical protein
MVVAGRHFFVAKNFLLCYLGRDKLMENAVELTWLIRLRIAASAAVGIIVLGIYAWPIVAPPDPFGVVSVVNGTISPYDVLVLLGLAFGAGLVAYFLSWPYGSQIGILAVPAGLAVWAVRSGNIGTLMQLDNSVVLRQQIYSTFCWEPLLWLALVIAGYLGVFLASHILHPAKVGETAKPQHRGIGLILNVIVAIVGSAIVAQFFIGMLARDFTVWNPTDGAAVAQPAIGQIVFAVLISFGFIGFLVQRILQVDYLWPIIGTSLVNLVAVSAYGSQKVLEYFIQRWPAVFFSNSVLAVLPVQIVAFGTLGAIAGYWIAVRYDYWHKHEAQGD